MTKTCSHLNQIQRVTPSAAGCEDCLRTGDNWVHLRLCLICGQVGCCDSSKNKHATRHYHETSHPIIRSFEPDENWKWCYIDELFIHLGLLKAAQHPARASHLLDDYASHSH
ncbi:ubiquitin-hydrolase Zn-finger-containing protein [Nitrosospira sp. Nsp14]|uniref:ubiquitin carboxyl-terminal hydrolase 14 n=1 Tax=Nitrosospira sp. Nsp14 TaxID=1855333 RepID=UPI0008F29AD7|nr:UBP-type zinc finger domain-containing protein [Nitrosospira sp. Nsp14]SFH25342.1 ubiquitin-hydrolase Zn-finger-containing protein [Nitrosospira sp. Nsp14]